MTAPLLSSTREQPPSQLFNRIAQDILHKGYSINPTALPLDLSHSLCDHVQQLDSASFVSAGVGRDRQHMINNFVRSDEICWINGDSAAGTHWLQWTRELQTFLNRTLFLGLYSFESHFSHYGRGDFYKRHLDAFKGQANRILSLIVYLNPDWQDSDGGELVLYSSDQDMEGIKITPSLGTVVTFLSEEFPHEVLPARRDRYAIAGWFRLNTSCTERVDPPS